MDGSTLVYGDWNRVVRDPLDVMRLAFLIAAIAFVAAGEYNSALRVGLTFAFLVGIRLLDLPRPLDLAMIVTMALQSAGYAAGLFAALSWYDEVLHSLLPGVVAAVLYVLLVRADSMPALAEDQTGPRRRYIGIVVAATGLGLIAGVIYEIYEYLVVTYLDAGLRIGYGDTIVDLALDLGSAALGGLFLVVWAEFGWGTARRAHPR